MAPSALSHTPHQILPSPPLFSPGVKERPSSAARKVSGRQMAISSFLSLAPFPAGGKDRATEIRGQGKAGGRGAVAAAEEKGADSSAKAKPADEKPASRAQMLLMAVETMGGNVHAMSVESGLGVYVGNVGAERAQRSVPARNPRPTARWPSWGRLQNRLATWWPRCDGSTSMLRSCRAFPCP